MSTLGVFQVRLEKIEETTPNPNNINIGAVRTGLCARMPTVGKPFRILHGRLFVTSPVTEVTEEGFKTANSTYRLTLL